MLLIIDCGCGGNSRGNVNVDLYVYNSPDTLQYIDVKKITNFINCDITNLPLRNAIGSVTCYHVIEHILNVNDAIRELKRICNDKVIIVVPNNPVMKEYYNHLYSWSKSSFKAYLLNFFDDVEIRIHTLRYLKRFYKFVNIIPIFFLRRKIYQCFSNFMGFDLIAICKVNK